MGIMEAEESESTEMAIMEPEESQSTERAISPLPSLDVVGRCT